MNIVMNPVSSSNIAAVGYSPVDSVMQVDFLNGTSYQYRDVPANVAMELINASSVGQYFNSIKTDYTFMKVG